MVPGTTGKIFAVTFFKWLCEWVWPSSKFYLANITQTSEMKNTKILFRNQFSCKICFTKYLVRRVSSNKRNLSTTCTKRQKNWQNGLILALRNARSLYSNGRVNLQVHASWRVLCTRQGRWRLFKLRVLAVYGWFCQLWNYAKGNKHKLIRTSTKSPAFQWEAIQTSFNIIKDMMCRWIILRSFMGITTKWGLL